MWIGGNESKKTIHKVFCLKVQSLIYEIGCTQHTHPKKKLEDFLENIRLEK